MKMAWVRFTTSWFLITALYAVVCNCQARDRRVGIYRMVPLDNMCDGEVELKFDGGAVVSVFEYHVTSSTCEVHFTSPETSTMFVAAERLALAGSGTCLVLTKDDVGGAFPPGQVEICNNTLFKFQTEHNTMSIQILAGPFPTGKAISFRLVVTPVMPGYNSRAFYCDNGDYISRYMEADGHRNCPDNSDEKDATSSSPCGHRLARCDSGLCISNTSKCDHFSDCPDSSDEHCVYPCPFETYQDYECADRSECYASYTRCDDSHECSDSSDDKNCDSCSYVSPFMGRDVSYCKELRFCLSKSEICDGVMDCPNGQDEDPDICNPSIYWYWTNGQLAGLFIGYIIFLVLVIAIVVMVHRKCRKEVD